jgi:hypothetical protein
MDILLDAQSTMRAADRKEPTPSAAHNFSQVDAIWLSSMTFACINAPTAPTEDRADNGMTQSMEK